MHNNVERCRDQLRPITAALKLRYRSPPPPHLAEVERCSAQAQVGSIVQPHSQRCPAGDKDPLPEVELEAPAQK